MSNARRWCFNVIINNAKRDHEKEKRKFLLPATAKTEALRNNIDTINENVLKINTENQQTRQQYVSPSPPD
jgi:hypothetical protein